MKATGLRIGNLVRNEHGSAMYVYRLWKDGAELSVDMDGSDDLDYLEDEIFGIPITKELLLNNKFSLDDSMSNLSTAKWYMIPLTKDNWLAVNVENKLFSVGEGVDWAFPMDLEFVHELQNIYQSFTRKELEFKL